MTWHKDYTNTEIDTELVNYIFKKRVANREKEIEIYLDDEGFCNIDIKLEFSTNNNEIEYISCLVNLEKLSIDTDKLHINKYEFITSVVNEYTKLTEEEITFNG